MAEDGLRARIGSTNPVSRQRNTMAATAPAAHRLASERGTVQLLADAGVLVVRVGDGGIPDGPGGARADEKPTACQPRPFHGHPRRAPRPIRLPARAGRG